MPISEKCVQLLKYKRLSLGCKNPKPCRSGMTVLEYGLYDGDPVTKVLLQPFTGHKSFHFIWLEFLCISDAIEIMGQVLPCVVDQNALPYSLIHPSRTNPSIKGPLQCHRPPYPW